MANGSLSVCVLLFIATIIMPLNRQLSNFGGTEDFIECVLGRFVWLIWVGLADADRAVSCMCDWLGSLLWLGWPESV